MSDHRMRRKGKGNSFFVIVGEVVEFLSHLMADKPLIPFLVPLVLVLWVFERWVFSLSNWVPLVFAVWATFQYSSYRRRILVEDLNKKWERTILSCSPTTPLEHCEWLNKLLMEIWLNHVNPKLSMRFSSIVEKRLKWHKPKFIEKVELQEFSLGSSPPSLGLQGTRWLTTCNQRIMQLGFDWDTSDLSILLLVKLSKPLGTAARIVINSLHMKSDLVLMPILDGRAILYSFVASPEVRIGVAFGSGGSQSLPATELPLVSSWLVRIFTESLVKTMVEPRRRCFSLPPVDLRNKAIGGIIHVTVVSASKLTGLNLRGSSSRKEQICSTNACEEGEHHVAKDLQTFVEVELGKLSRRTEVGPGSSPRWDATFNMVLHEEAAILQFNLYNSTPNSVKYDYMASCEIKMKYVADDSTIFWAIGPNSSVIAKHAEFCGKEVEMVVPFEGDNSGELYVKLVMKEWQFSDGSHSSNKLHSTSQQSFSDGSSKHFSRTGRKIKVVVVEGKDLNVKERTGKCDPYVKLQYGKGIWKTKTQHVCNPKWNQKFEFDEIVGGEYLKIKCYNEDMFGDDNSGSAHVNLGGLVEGLNRDVWIPLENVSSGEVRLQLEAGRVDENEGSRGSGNGLIELTILEARDLKGADLSGTSDPYVKVNYGKVKKRTKVVYKTVNPEWNQTLEFPDDGSTLELHVKDHNALLPESSIGDCVIEYQGLPPNQISDKWIPLQGVQHGEVHIQITRKIPEPQRSSLDSESSVAKSSQLSNQMKEMMMKFQSLIEDENLEGLTMALSEMQSLEDTRGEYITQLETEQMLLLDKIKELGREIMK